MKKKREAAFVAREEKKREARRERVRRKLATTWGSMKEKYPDAFEDQVEFLSRSFFEKNESLITRVGVFVLCCACWFWFVHVPVWDMWMDSETTEGSVPAAIFLWIVFLSCVIGILVNSPGMRLSRLPFMRARWLRFHTVLRSVLAVGEVVVLSAVIFAVAVSGLLFAVLLFFLVAALITTVARRFL